MSPGYGGMEGGEATAGPRAERAGQWDRRQERARDVDREKVEVGAEGKGGYRGAGQREVKEGSRKKREDRCEQRED